MSAIAAVNPNYRTVRRLIKAGFIAVSLTFVGILTGPLFSGSIIAGLFAITPAHAGNYGIAADSDGHISFYFSGGHRGKHHRYGYGYGYGHRGYYGGHYGSYYGRHHRGHHRGHRYGHHRGYRDHYYRHRQHRHYGGPVFGNPHRYRHHRYHGYSNHARNCHPVSKNGFWHGRHAKIGGTMCYDRYGNGYVISNSRHLIHYY